MTSLTDLAENVLADQGWTTRRQGQAARAHLHFDLIAENPTAIVFVESLSSIGLQRRADALAAAVASVTLARNAGVKAWEAYLVLLIEDGVSADASTQAVQRDLNYCRKIVIDGAEIIAAVDPREAMEAAMSFLFPLGVAFAPAAEDVRAQLTELIVEKGHDRALVEALVRNFDTESECKCWERVGESVPGTADE